MYDYRTVERALGKRDYFPNAGEQAYFDPQSQTIHLARITKSAYDKALARQDLPTLRAQLGTMLHEITHWADLVGTLWGREYLRAVYVTLQLLPMVRTAGGEHEFHRFIELHDWTRRIMLSRYFRTVSSSPGFHDHRRPWRIQLSAGREFDPWGRLDDGRPVMFARFNDHARDEQVARQPVVVGALLEVNAVWSELRTNEEALSQMSDVERVIEERLVNAERLAELYHPDLTLYTAPAHLLAMTARTTDLSTAYRLGSSVAHVVLNLRDEDFDKLALPAEMAAWANLFDGFRTSRDRGFAYGAICQSASPWTEGRPVNDWLDEALARVGLGPAASIYAAAHKQMCEEGVTITSDLLGRAQGYLLSLGPAVLAIGSLGDTALTPKRLAAERLAAPPMFDPDGNLIELSSGTFDKSLFDPEALHQAAAALHTWTQNFLNACR